jgi:hypothetical protein
LGNTQLTGFGTDYRELTTTSGTADTTTSVKNAKSTGYFIFDPFTSSSTLTGTPSATTLKGYGWRSNGVYGKVIPPGTWQFNLTLTSSSASGNGHIEIWVYSCTTSGGSVTNLFYIDATSTNVLATTATTTYTFTYTSSSSYDLTNLVLVIEYWLHVTVAGTSSTGKVTLTTVSTASSVKIPHQAIWNNVATWSFQTLTKTWVSVSTWTFSLASRIWNIVTSWTFNLNAKKWYYVASWDFNLITVIPKVWHDIAYWNFNLATKMWNIISQWVFSLSTVIGKFWHDITFWSLNLAIEMWNTITLWNLKLGISGVFELPIGMVMGLFLGLFIGIVFVLALSGNRK